MNLETLSTISKSLPKNFSFYSFGEVSLAGQRTSINLQGKAGVSFKLLGDPAAFLIVLFDSNLDHSMYTELGNIIASRLCQGLSEKGEGDLMITPPLAVSALQLERFARRNLPFVHHFYEHVDQGKTVLVETLIMPVEDMIGHA